MISTTTCNYTVPKRYDGTMPTGNNQVFNFASSSCVTVGISSSTTSTSPMYDPLITSGDVLIGFWLMTLTAFLFVRFAILDS